MSPPSGRRPPVSAEAVGASSSQAPPPAAASATSARKASTSISCGWGRRAAATSRNASACAVHSGTTTKQVNQATAPTARLPRSIIETPESGSLAGRGGGVGWIESPRRALASISARRGERDPRRGEPRAPSVGAGSSGDPRSSGPWRRQRLTDRPREGTRRSRRSGCHRARRSRRRRGAARRPRRGRGGAGTRRAERGVGMRRQPNVGRSWVQRAAAGAGVALESVAYTAADDARPSPS